VPFGEKLVSYSMLIKIYNQKKKYHIHKGEDYTYTNSCYNYFHTAVPDVAALRILAAKIYFGE
jgi:hypothetical protein